MQIWTKRVVYMYLHIHLSMQVQISQYKNVFADQNSIGY